MSKKNKPKYFGASRKCWNYCLMTRADVIYRPTTNALNERQTPKSTHNEFKAIGN